MGFVGDWWDMLFRLTEDWGFVGDMVSWSLFLASIGFVIGCLGMIAAGISTVFGRNRT